MIDVCLLGTGGMMPLPYRWLTSLLVRYNGSSLLIDCGEGTQIAMKEKGWSFKPIDVICFTHYHADHISGLPGLLLTMGNAERTEPLTMIGPKGLERVVTVTRWSWIGRADSRQTGRRSRTSRWHTGTACKRARPSRRRAGFLRRIWCWAHRGRASS